MWTQFVEDNKLEGTAHVLDEGPQQAEGIKLSAGKCWGVWGGLLLGVVLFVVFVVFVGRGLWWFAE